MSPLPEIEVHAATAGRWPDVEAVFREAGVAEGPAACPAGRSCGPQVG